MVRVRPLVPDPLENHCVTLVEVLRQLPDRHRYDLAHEPSPICADVRQPPLSEATGGRPRSIAKGYTFDEPAIDLGVLMENDEPVPAAVVRIPLSMLNRHGLVAGATGTGKTKTLQLMAEQISAAGVPVFAADIKGDLSGIAAPGAAERQAAGADEEDRSGLAAAGLPDRVLRPRRPRRRRAAARDDELSFGPTLLAKVLGLNEVQESSLGLVFHYADSQGLPLLDLTDLRAVLQHLTSDEGKAELKDIGGLSAATAGVILRSLITFADQGAEAFFGEPEFDTADLLRVTADGRGVVSLLELPNLQDRPALFSTFLMWLLADLFHDLPEVGDIDKPKLVFFFDEAHLLFDDASKAFLDAIAQTVRLIRSKGVGIFFVTQTPEGRAGRRTGPARLAGAAPAPRAYAERRQGSQADRRDVPQVALRPRRDTATARHRRGDRHGDGSGRRADPGRLDPDAGARVADGGDSGGGPAAGDGAVCADGQVRPGDRSGLRARDTRPRVTGGRRGGGARASGEGGCGAPGRGGKGAGAS